MADVHAAYHLLLRRPPDESGLDHYRRLIAEQHIPRDQIVVDMLHSPEFAQQHLDLISAGKVVELVDVGDFQIRVNPMDKSIGAWIAKHRSYEPEVTSLVRSLLRPGDTFIDIGANLGWFSLVAAQAVGSEGQVVAIEPNADHCESIRASADTNGFVIDVVACAVSDGTGWIALQTDLCNGWVKELGPLGPDSEPITCSYVVPQFSLDQVLGERPLPRVDLMKVDVEGVEPLVFRGAQSTLDRWSPRVVFEWFPESLKQRGFSPSEPLDFLRSRGYAISVVGRDPEDLTDAQLDAERASQSRELLELLAQPVC